MSAVLLALACTYGMWVLFLAAMAMRWAWPRLSRTARVLAAPVALVAYVCDLAFNIAATLVFFDRPREATFSQRMGRYQSQQIGRRAAVARWVCATLLDPFQIGGHCRG